MIESYSAMIKELPQYMVLRPVDKTTKKIHSIRDVAKKKPIIRIFCEHQDVMELGSTVKCK